MRGVMRVTSSSPISQPIPTHQCIRFSPVACRMRVSLHHGDDLLHVSLTVHSPIPQDSRKGADLFCKPVSFPNVVPPGLHHRFPPKATRS